MTMKIKLKNEIFMWHMSTLVCKDTNIVFLMLSIVFFCFHGKRKTT